jgi:hypothetical protein
MKIVLIGLTPGDGARIGATDFDTWFATEPQGAGR